MVVDVKTKAMCQIDIEPDEAFRILCKTLDMEFVLNEDIDFYVVHDTRFGDEEVCYTRDGHDEVYDDRGELFLALRAVAAELFPNTSFRKNIPVYIKD